MVPHLKEIVKLLIITSTVVNVNSQNEDVLYKPDTCHRPPEFLYRQCCIFPPFFTREVAKECGARFAMYRDSNVQKLKVVQMIRAADTDVIHWRCVLRKYKMLTPDNLLDEEKYFAHLDKWAKLNPSFTNVIQQAKAECKLYYGVYFPLEVDKFYKLNGCVRNYININCPAVISTKECHEVQKFYQECGKYFF